jgi:hypothetical protein
MDNTYPPVDTSGPAGCRSGLVSKRVLIYFHINANLFGKRCAFFE